MTLLYFRVGADYQFLVDTLSDVAKTDLTIRKLMGILKDVHREGIRQPINLMLLRSVYKLYIYIHIKSINFLGLYDPCERIEQC